MDDRMKSIITSLFCIMAIISFLVGRKALEEGDYYKTYWCYFYCVFMLVITWVLLADVYAGYIYRLYIFLTS